MGWREEGGGGGGGWRRGKGGGGWGRGVGGGGRREGRRKGPDEGRESLLSGRCARALSSARRLQLTLSVVTAVGGRAAGLGWMCGGCVEGVWRGVEVSMAQSESGSQVKHNRTWSPHGWVMADRYVLRLWELLEISPGSNSVQTLTKILRMR